MRRTDRRRRFRFRPVASRSVLRLYRRCRAKRAWAAANKREREAAESERREPELLVPISLHLCRHTFASLMIDAGANPKAIQEFMGHSKIQTTFDVYGHLLPGSRDEVRERMNAYLRRSNEP